MPENPLESENESELRSGKLKVKSGELELPEKEKRIPVVAEGTSEGSGSRSVGSGPKTSLFNRALGFAKDVQDRFQTEAVKRRTARVENAQKRIKEGQAELDVRELEAKADSLQARRKDLDRASRERKLESFRGLMGGRADDRPTLRQGMQSRGLTREEPSALSLALQGGNRPREGKEAPSALARALNEPANYRAGTGKSALSMAMESGSRGLLAGKHERKGALAGALEGYGKKGKLRLG